MSYQLSAKRTVMEFTVTRERMLRGATPNSRFDPTTVTVTVDGAQVTSVTVTGPAVLGNGSVTRNVIGRSYLGADMSPSWLNQLMVENNLGWPQ